MNLGCEICGDKSVETGLCKKCKVADEIHFITMQAVVAKHVNVLLRERGDTPADRVIRWLSIDGMIGNPLAVTVAKHVYARYLATTPSKPETIVDELVGYYVLLGKALDRAGVQI